MRLGKYLMGAFKNRWNLLLLAGGMGFAALAAPAVFIPLVLAGEVAYLGFLGTHPKFQKYLDAQAAKAARLSQADTVEARRDEMLGELSQDMRGRFEALRSRCLEIRRIAMDLRHPGAVETKESLDDLQLAGLDRLLWIYLRLLYTRQAIERFLAATNDREIQADVKRLEGRLAEAQKRPDDANKEKILRALQDNLDTTKERLANWQKAQSSHELLDLEIDRLETKIQTLSEMAINRQEPDYVVSQVDQVAKSMMDTERTMNDLEFATGLTVADEAVPELVRGAEAQVQRT